MSFGGFGVIRLLTARPRDLFPLAGAAALAAFAASTLAAAQPSGPTEDDNNADDGARAPSRFVYAGT